MHERCRRSRAGMRTLMALVAAWLCAPVLAAPPDLSGRWLPVPALASDWPDPLPLTDAGRARLSKFFADRDEPASFCMPLGTPRNTLSGTSVLEVLQTDDRVYFVFQPDLLNVETRRVYLDGRPLPPPEKRLPTWFGSSRGRWDGNALMVDTVDLEPQALLDGNGLSHSGKLELRERWHLGRDRIYGRVLIDELTLHDRETFTQPVTQRRVFAWAPAAQFAEGRCSERLWIDSLWRQRLSEHAESARAGHPRSTPDRVGNDAGASP